MSYWKNIWEGFGDQLPKRPEFEFARRELWVLLWILVEILLIWKPAGAEEKFAHLCLPQAPKTWRTWTVSETRVPNPTLRDPDQVPFKSYVLDGIVVKERAQQKPSGALIHQNCGIPPLGKRPGAEKAGGSGWQGAALSLLLGPPARLGTPLRKV